MALTVRADESYVRRPVPTVYVAPLRRIVPCRSRRSGLLRRTAVSKHRHRSRGFRAGRKCQRNSATLLGPGPQARRTLATFLLWKVARPQAEHPLKNETDVSPCGASFFLSDQKETKESPGADSPCQGEMSRSDRGGRDRGFWERPAASASVFHEPLSPGPPGLRGSQRGAWAVASGAETS